MTGSQGERVEGDRQESVGLLNIRAVMASAGGRARKTPRGRHTHCRTNLLHDSSSVRPRDQVEP
jgi:hypothetical protein